MTKGTKGKTKERGSAEIRFNIAPLIALTIGVLLVLLGIEYFILSSNNRDTASQSANMMIEQVEALMSNNGAKEFSELLAEMPVHEGMSIIVAEADSSHMIIGATYHSEVGKSLTNIGIDTKDVDSSDTSEFDAVVDNVNSFCVSRHLDDDIIVIAQDLSYINRSIPIILLTMLIYLLLAATAIGFIVRNMTLRLLNEQRNANTDALTGLLNRRAYQDELGQLATDPRRHSLAYVSLDLNGLKQINDRLGHEAGDDLLRAAAAIMKEHFGKYGRIYRIGGDEFAALIYPDREQMEQTEKDFTRSLTAWSQDNGMELSISFGSAWAEDHPDLDLTELGKVADEIMYHNKALYYQNQGKDRRRRD